MTGHASIIRPNNWITSRITTAATQAVGLSSDIHAVVQPLQSPAVSTTRGSAAVSLPAPALVSALSPREPAAQVAELLDNTAADESTTPSPSGKSRLLPYQIFLIVFFGLASIPISILVVYIFLGPLRRRDFRHDEEWSSSVWKRKHNRQQPSGSSEIMPERTDEEPRSRASCMRAGLGRLVGLRGDGTRRSAPNDQPGRVRETEVGRAWGRPRAIEDELDTVYVVAAPQTSVAAPATANPAGSKTRTAGAAEEEEDSGTGQEDGAETSSTHHRASKRPDIAIPERAVTRIPAVPTDQAPSKSPSRALPFRAPASTDSEDGERGSAADAVVPRIRPLSTLGLLDTLERATADTDGGAKLSGSADGQRATVTAANDAKAKPAPLALGALAEGDGPGDAEPQTPSSAVLNKA